MNERNDPPVGALGEEAAKLLRVLQDWTKEPTGSPDPRVSGSLPNDLSEHIATGGKDCRYCPLCQVISGVRAMSPEVRHHLGVAASSMLQAAAGLLATPPVERRSGSTPVERIDLDDAWEDD